MALFPMVTGGGSLPFTKVVASNFQTALPQNILNVPVGAYILFAYNGSVLSPITGATIEWSDVNVSANCVSALLKATASTVVIGGSGSVYIRSTVYQ